MTNHINFTTARFSDDPAFPPMYAVIPDDETDGFIVGEWSEVLALADALDRLVESGEADEEISHLDERLGVKWLTVSEAAEQWGLSKDTVRWAAREGHIREAQSERGRWRFPQRTFLHWLHEKHRPRKPRR